MRLQQLSNDSHAVLSFYSSFFFTLSVLYSTVFPCTCYFLQSLYFLLSEIVGGSFSFGVLLWVDDVGLGLSFIS